MNVNAIKVSSLSQTPQCQPLRSGLKNNACTEGGKLNFMTHDNVKLSETLGNKLNILA